MAHFGAALHLEGNPLLTEELPFAEELPLAEELRSTLFMSATAETQLSRSALTRVVRNAKRHPILLQAPQFKSLRVSCR